MGFRVHSYDGSNRIAGIEYLPASAITPKIGLALKQTNGLLALATGTAKPTYISMCEKDSACASGDIIPVIRVQDDVTYETSFSAAASTSGVAEVVYIDDAAKDGMCRVRF